MNRFKLIGAILCLLYMGNLGQAQENQGDTLEPAWHQSLLAQKDEPTIFERFEALYDSIAQELQEQPKLGRWRWAKDGWMGKDKWEHLQFYTIFYEVLIETGMKPREAFWATFGISLLNEMKDGLIPAELYGSILGGDGGSFKDPIWSNILPLLFQLLPGGK